MSVQRDSQGKLYNACEIHCWHVMHNVGLCCNCPARWRHGEGLDSVVEKEVVK